MPHPLPGPRRIWTAAEWEARERPRPPLGQWLVDNLPRGANLEPPRERGSARAIPFAAGDGSGGGSGGEKESSEIRESRTKLS